METSSSMDMTRQSSIALFVDFIKQALIITPQILSQKQCIFSNLFPFLRTIYLNTR